MEKRRSYWSQHPAIPARRALEGFKDVAGTEMIVFYPENGVSPMQKRQMNTQEGENVCVCAIHGNFDDAQTGVKKIFTDPVIKAELAQHNKMFSSANSINWGRLLPQIVYYFSAYLDLVNAKKIKMGDAINVVVPTGNFGNILASYYAKRMGLPGTQVYLRVEQQQRADGFYPHRYVRQKARVLYHHFAVHGYSGLQQSGKTALPLGAAKTPKSSQAG